MKLDAQEIIKTSCKECVFAKYDGTTQVDCCADKISYFKEQDKIIEAYDNDKEFYVIRGFCNFYRKTGWNNNIPDKELAKQEISPTYDIIINCNEIDKESQGHIINALNSISYNKEKIKISLYYNKDQDKNNRSLCLEILAIFQPIFNITISVCLDNNEYIFEYLRNKLTTSYFMFLDRNNCQNINMNILNILCEEMNEKNKKILIAKKENCNIISSVMYKIYSYENVENNISQNIEKIIEMCKEKNMFFEIET